MKANFLKIAGVNSEAEFYQKFPSEEAFFAAYPEAQNMPMMKSGGNAPTNPTLWSRAKSLARQKFDVYPSAYANGWAAKWYKGKGGGWRKAEYGGMMMGDGGIPNNPGFNALPSAVQQNIIDNMAYGGSAQQAATAIAMKAAGKKPKDYYAEGGTNNPGFQALPEYVQEKILSNMAKGGQMPAEIARARFAAAGNLDQLEDYGYMYGGTPEMEQMREGGIPERYKNMGFSSVGAKKNSTRPGKKWMVLAKKGDDYKVVHGGYDGMKDFSQHGSTKRKENFWNRMGGKDSAKANDPFSPLYWHKRFGTWQEGGAPMQPQLLMKENYRDMNSPFRSKTMEADRAGDAMVMSAQGQKMMEDKLMMEQQQQAFRMANPNYDEQVMRAQLIQKYGVMKDGDFFPNQVYLNERGRIVPPASSSTSKMVAKTAQSAMNYKKGGSTYSGGVFFEEGGTKISVPNARQMQQSDDSMNQQAQMDPLMNGQDALIYGAQLIQNGKRQINPGVMGDIQEKLMDQYVNPYSLTNMANFTGNIIEGVNNQRDMRDALDRQRQNYSTDNAYMPTGNNTMSRGQYDMYGQMVPDRIGGNLSFTGMNQKYSTGVTRFAEGGMSDFDYVADIVTPVVTEDPIGKARMMANMVASDNTRVERQLPMDINSMQMAPMTPDNVDIRTVIGSKESNNDYGALPKKKDGSLASSAVGKYQFLWDQHKDSIQSVTGIGSKEAFRNSPEAQEKFFDYWNNTILTPVANDIKSAFNPNMSINDIKQIVHFQGPTGAKRFFSTGSYTKDAFGSTPLSYLQKQYKKGGEIEVTQEELMQILKMGGQVEFC